MLIRELYRGTLVLCRLRSLINEAIRYFICVIFSIISLLPLEVFAATDGVSGGTSTAQTTVSITLPKLIRISNVADFTFASYSGSGVLAANRNLRISTNYGTAATRRYRITATGSGTGGNFRVTNGTTTLTYTTRWRDAAVTTGSVNLTRGVALTNRQNASKPLSSATLNANVQIQFTQAALLAVDAGLYTGTLTLLIAPE